MKRTVLAIVVAGSLMLSAGMAVLGVGVSHGGAAPAAPTSDPAQRHEQVGGSRGGLCPPKEVCPWMGAVDGGADRLAGAKPGIAAGQNLGLAGSKPGVGVGSNLAGSKPGVGSGSNDAGAKRGIASGTNFVGPSPGIASGNETAGSKPGIGSGSNIIGSTQRMSSSNQIAAGRGGICGDC